MATARGRVIITAALDEFLSSSSDSEDDELIAAILDHRGKERLKVVNFGKELSGALTILK